jgi:biotin/methionine sulfoxide reductase
MGDIRELPLTSTHWGAYRTQTTDGRVTALHGFEEDIDVSPIGPGIVEVLDDDTRIKAPMVRKSWLEGGPGTRTEGRGAEPFVEVSWAQAHKLVADELARVRETHGNQALFAGAYGWASAGRFHHAQSQLHRFFNCIGGYTRSVNTYSFAAAEVVVPHVLGGFREFLATATSWPSIIENTELFVAFGGVPLKNGQINSGGVGRHSQREAAAAACAAGLQFVNIGPLRGDVDESLNAEWLAPRPSTDTAIMLALAHTLLENERYDQAFVARYCVGFERFREYLLGTSDGIVKNVEWAAAICELPAATLHALALRMASQRTMISISWSLTRQDHGEQTYWAAITLAAMLGQIGLPGGGIGFGYSAINSIGNHATSIPGAALPQGQNAVKEFIPVARISDMLLNPGAPFDYDGTAYTYPDIRLVYWAGGNPFHHHQDLNRLLEAWRKPDTVVVHEWCWNPLAKMADIVLPCTTSLERNDLGLSPRDPYLIHMQQAVAPVAGSRNDYDIFRGIAAELGVEDAFSEGRDENAWLRWLYAKTMDSTARRGHQLPDYDSLREQGWFKLDAPAEPTVMLSAFRADPMADPLKTPSGKIELFSATVAGFNYDDCPGHAAWFEPLEWLGKHDSPYPLHLISNQPATKLHSQLDHGSHSRASKINGREPLTMHPDDAAVRKIGMGDVVKVFNARGMCFAAVILSDRVRRGVVQLSTGAWFDPQTPGEIGSACKHGNPNVLTPDVGTSRLAQGPIAHSCLVEVSGAGDELPPVTAFEAPQIIKRKNEAT